MSERKRSVYITKERLPNAETTKPKPTGLTSEIIGDCAEKMRVALQTPNKISNMITFIELEQ
jgi:hypothetical protein